MVLQNAPKRHADIGSRVDGFVAHVAVFRDIEVFDIRPLKTTAQGITFKQLDILGPVPLELIGAYDSVSCLHALEHFGLGRYGDPIDAQGHARALANIVKLLKPKGKLYLSVPIGTQRIEFNAHRVFSPNTIVDLLQADCALASLSFVDDEGDVHERVSATEEEMKTGFGCQLGCGIFEFERR